MISSQLFLHGHAFIKQFWVSVSCPGHFEPPLEGGGSEQVLCRPWEPSPQVLEQLPTLLQGDQLPFTGKKRDASIRTES